MAIEKQPSCDDPFEPELLPVDIALSRIRKDIVPVSAIETVSLRESLGRVLAEDLD